jgi:hypothetical protein
VHEEQERAAEKAGRELEAEKVAVRVGKVVHVASLVALLFIVLALLQGSSVEYRWVLQIAVFLAVATAPQWAIDRTAAIAELVSPDLPLPLSKRGFRNLGAFVGVVERLLYLGAFVAGYPQFIAVWLVFKGIAGYRLGLDDAQRMERRVFQLFLLNNAMSLAGALLGWLVWNLLGLPTMTEIR